MQSLCFATNNQHKLDEVRQILSGRYSIKSLKDIGCNEELPETANTFEGNSLQKATYIFDRYHLPCIADDSGLEVEALDGEPGVYSARYAGLQRSDADNNALLLSKLKDQENRKAQFRTVITYIDDKGRHYFFEGKVAGNIALHPSGENGFGYDPIFIPEGYSLSFAQMESTEKNMISHRSIAINKLAEFLKDA